MTNINNNELDLGFNLGSFDKGGGYDRPVNVPDGASFWRIMPPANPSVSRELFHKYALHWGFTNAAGKKNPVQCSYPHERFCPIDQRVFEAERLLERAKQNNDKEKEKEFLEYISEWRARIQFIYNAVNSQGEVVLLSVGKTVTDGIGIKIAEAVNTWKINPISLTSGLWFQITKTGKGFQTEYAVDFKKVNTLVNGVPTQTLDQSALPQVLVDAINQQMVGGAGPLKDIHNQYAIKTAAELKLMMDGQLPAASSSSTGTVGQQIPAPTFVPPPVVRAPTFVGGVISNPVLPASTAIPPTMTMGATSTSPGMVAPTPPISTTSNSDATEARKRLLDRLNAGNATN